MSTKENEVNVDVLLNEMKHIPNAVKFDWHSDMPGSPDGAYPERMWTLTASGGEP